MSLKLIRSAPHAFPELTWVCPQCGHEQMASITLHGGDETQTCPDCRATETHAYPFLQSWYTFWCGELRPRMGMGVSR